MYATPCLSFPRLSGGWRMFFSPSGPKSRYSHRLFHEANINSVCRLLFLKLDRISIVVKWYHQKCLHLLSLSHFAWDTQLKPQGEKQQKSSLLWAQRSTASVRPLCSSSPFPREHYRRNPSWCRPASPVVGDPHDVALCRWHCCEAHINQTLLTDWQKHGMKNRRTKASKSMVNTSSDLRERRTVWKDKQDLRFTHPEFRYLRPSDWEFPT